jgi:hypothetical protein
LARKILKRKLYSPPAGKPEGMWTDAVKRDARKMLWAAEWKILRTGMEAR